MYFKHKYLMSALILLTSMGLSAASFTRSGNFITVEVAHPGPNDPQWVRLQVIGKKIIRVEATREKTFPEKQSLIIVKQPMPAFSYSVSEDSRDVKINTSAVVAKVDKQTGLVRFYDENGKQILAEDTGGKQLFPYTVPEREIGVDSHLTDVQKHGWTWLLRFADNKGEALYGLGQHQANELNMKGLNEELYQYNTKVSVPFVVSNKGYGILWDSYSYCRFGNPGENLPLNRAFRLYDKNGEAGSLTGTYTDRDGKTITRAEDSICYEVSLPALALKRNSDGDVSHLPAGFKLNGAHVTYEGYLEAPADNDYHFNLYYAGYTKVYVDGKEVVPEHWRQAWNPNACRFNVPMKAGQKVKLLIDWLPDGDVSYCALRVAPPCSEERQQQLTVWSEMAKDLDYYFIAGNTTDELIHGYRTLTGKAQVLPKWALGFWQSRERYKTSGDIEQTLAEFRRRHIPVDNIVQDWNYWADDQWGSHQFEASRYPNPQAMLDSVHQMHGRFMISVWPKFYPNTKNYQELDAHGWMYHQSIADSIRDWVDPGYMNSFYDAYAEGARKMFWRQMDENLYSKYHFGIDAWWMDASEPNVRDCTPMWYRKALSGPTAMGSSTEYFNAYSLANADAIYNGQREVNPNQRVFLLTRSGFAGEQRYSTATWSGDIGTRWEDMRAQMTAGLNYNLAGLPFWGMDQGGFSVENRYVKAQQLYDQTGEENADLKEWRELQTRWNEFGCFIPLYRTHGQWPLREVWNIAPESHPAYKAIVWYDRLRYRLMPYIYSLAGAVHFSDYTMMRALVMDFNGDDKVYNVKDQWMFGPSLMACPVAKYQARSREVYLPAQRGWYDLLSGKHYGGGQTITADAPLERIPVFVPEGSLLPVGPEMERSDEKSAETIDLYVFAGHDGSFTLYEDENTNYNYEEGRYATIPMIWNERQHTLTIGARKGSFNGMLKSRQFNIIVVSPTHVQGIDIDHAAKGKVVKYNGARVAVKL